MRRKIYDIIEVSKVRSGGSAVYDAVMVAVIIVSLVPLVFKSSNLAFSIIDKVTAALFILDYAARLFTADLKLERGPMSFVLYPFTPMAIIDLLAILPTFTPMAAGWRLVKLLRLFRALRVFRTFKLLRYSKSIGTIINVIQTQRVPLAAVTSMAAAYVLISALVIFNVEPDTFGSFFDAIYWATVSLTTVGYGDIYPVTTVGRIVTMLSSIVGIAIVALPSGIITAGYMDELNKEKAP
jgi:voltage-gated potassium channel